MKVFEFGLLSGGDMSGNITSNSQQLTFMFVASIQAVFTGSPNGALKLQVSNDNVNWTDYIGSSTSITQAGNFVWLLTEIGYPWIRVFYTFSSGTGSLAITVNGKGA